MSLQQIGARRTRFSARRFDQQDGGDRDGRGPVPMSRDLIENDQAVTILIARQPDPTEGVEAAIRADLRQTLATLTAQLDALTRERQVLRTLREFPPSQLVQGPLSRFVREPAV